MSKKHEKEFQYASEILNAMSTLFEEDHENCMDLEELNKGDNLTHFIHALANVAPTTLYNKLTNDNVNQLEFNHMANQLCFQYNKKDNDE